MNSLQKSRRSLLGTTLALPVLSVVRAAALRSPLSLGHASSDDLRRAQSKAGNNP